VLAALFLVCTMERCFVAGTDTGIGKTYCSAVISLALEADYWKPLQAGDLESSDSLTVRALTQGKVTIHPEAVRLQMPASPHAAAAAEGLVLDPENWVFPEHQGNLVIEGAGGLLVPLTQELLYADWVEQQGLPVVLISGNRLGSINHTLLTIEALMVRNIDVLGILFNGDAAPSSESFIEQYSGIPILGRVPWVAKPSPESVAEAANVLRPVLGALFQDIA
jgi:dethiobiotin synthetase